MENIRNITSDIYYVGGDDKELELFENLYPITNGVAYNSYLVVDEKTVLLDTADEAIADTFLANIKAALNGKNLDYVIVNHMEPDHSATLKKVLDIYPEAMVVTNKKVIPIINQFFGIDITPRAIVVDETSEFTTGKHTFKFVMAPLVHWPEVMVTYDAYDKTLYSADAFGTFGILGDRLFGDEYDFENELLCEARRYFTNIVGKFGTPVQNLLKKAANLEIERICPLHGPIWRSDFGKFIEKYDLWSKYEAEEKGVLIVYGTVYSNTEKAAKILENKLNEKGIKTAIYDSSKTHVSHLVAESFKYSHIALGSITYNGNMFPRIETYLLDLKNHNFQNKAFALFENASWAAAATKNMKAAVEAMKGCKVLDATLTIKSALTDENINSIALLADAIESDM